MCGWPTSSICPCSIGSDHMIEPRPLPHSGVSGMSGSSGPQMPSRRPALTVFMSPVPKPMVMRSHTGSGAIARQITAAHSTSASLRPLNFHITNAAVAMPAPRMAPRENDRMSAMPVMQSVMNSPVLSVGFLVSHHTNTSSA